jgi:zinc D-Ala-D-Ala dipeptidase
MRFFLAIFVGASFFVTQPAKADALGVVGRAYGQVPVDFVDIQKVAPTIKVEMRYLSDWNFLGRKVTGYLANKCYLTKAAADALAKVQVELATQNLSLLMLDCYRPQRAVDDFLLWVKDNDLKMQKYFYPTQPKATLVERGYISDKSGHSRGSTVDLTIVKTGTRSDYKEAPADCRAPQNIEATGQLDMGTYYDCFSDLANTASPAISAVAKKNRELLVETMKKAGFGNYSKEWWHYTLKNEPYKDKYFDFVVQ